MPERLGLPPADQVVAILEAVQEFKLANDAYEAAFRYEVDEAYSGRLHEAMYRRRGAELQLLEAYGATEEDAHDLAE